MVVSGAVSLLGRMGLETEGMRGGGLLRGFVGWCGRVCCWDWLNRGCWEGYCCIRPDLLDLSCFVKCTGKKDVKT
jgi:hypothetical protein